MYSMQTCIGACPSCGDELYLFKTKSHARLVKCVNDNCEKHIIYGVPKKGSIEVTGLYCPRSQYPVLAITPLTKLSATRIKKESGKGYFWVQQPCFSCSIRSNCMILEELEDYF